MTNEGSDYLFVIDTDQYAGNFEREMCAFLTGRVGDCGVGQEMAAKFHKEFGDKGDDMFENIASVPDDSGCSRPATIWPNPRYANDGMGGHYLIEKVDQKKACAAYVKSVENIYGGYIRNTQDTLNRLEKGEKVANWTVAAAKKEIARHQAEINKAKKLKKVSAYPAYMSVGIWFYEKPTAEQLDLLKARAAKFVEECAKENKERPWKQQVIKIESFRLVTFVKNSSEERL